MAESERELVIGYTRYVGGIHVARLETMVYGGFAQAICRSSLWVSVGHEDDVPVLATLEDTYAPGWERPSCKRCIAGFHKAVEKLFS